MTKKKTHEEYVAQVKEKHGDALTVVGTYVNSKTKVEHQCERGLEHSNWSATPSSVSRLGTGCPACAGNIKITHEQYAERVKEVHGDSITVVGRYLNSDTKIEHHCERGLNHPNWSAAPPSVGLTGTGCPACAGNIKITHEQYVERVKEVHGVAVTVVDTYVNGKAQIMHRCNAKPGHPDWLVSPGSVTSGSGCPACAGNIKVTHDDYVERVKELHGDSISLVGKYTTARTAIMHRCEAGLGHPDWFATPNTVQSGRGCRACGYLRASEALKKTHADYVAEVKKIHGEAVSVVGTYSKARSHLLHRCESVTAHPDWLVTPGSVVSQRTGCPKCLNKNEGRIAELLTSIHVVFRQFRLDDPGGRKFYDFFLPDFSLIIEYDGMPHYFGWRSCKDNLAHQQSNDAYKVRLAKVHGYRIARIPYWLTEEEERIEIDNILLGHPTYPEVPDLEQAITKPKPVPVRFRRSVVRKQSRKSPIDRRGHRTFRKNLDDQKADTGR